MAEDKAPALPSPFLLVAIPWPLKRDLELTQWLQERVSSIIVDILLLMEHEARLEGTVIDVGVFGKIGVDQACSGINGLQASLVVTLFLGAYYRIWLGQPNHSCHWRHPYRPCLQPWSSLFPFIPKSEGQRALFG